MSKTELIAATEMKLLAPYYDVDEAVRFICKRVNVSPDIVSAVLFSRDRYHTGLGLIPDDPELGMRAAQIRAAQPDLFRADHIAARYVCTGHEKEFIARDAGVDGQTVAAAMAADTDYMRQQGIIVDVLTWEPEADDY